MNTIPLGIISFCRAAHKYVVPASIYRIGPNDRTYDCLANNAATKRQKAVTMTSLASMSALLFWAYAIVIVGSETVKVVETPCGSLMCQNSAQCITDSSSFESHRLPDGSLLDVELDEGGSRCSCTPGWTGNQCDIEFVSCEGDHKC